MSLPVSRPKSDNRRLVFKRYRSGRVRPMWYGDATINGKRRVFTLVPFDGNPPSSGSISDRGDKKYEQSRARALAMLDDLLGGEQTTADRQSMVERALSYKYGIHLQSVALVDLIAAWDQIPRKRKQSDFHKSNCHRILRRFVDYMTANWPDVSELGGVKEEHVREFLQQEEARNISARTWNVTLSVLKSAFIKLDDSAEAYRKYLSKVPSKEENTVHRVPYTPQEMRAILDAAKITDPLLFNLITTAYCSGLRRGDLCQLKWSDVDLEQGFVTVTTSKTGEKIEFPILPLLKNVLESVWVPPKERDNQYVFPEAASIYLNKPYSLDHRLRNVLFAAGFRDPDSGDDNAKSLEVISHKEIVKKAEVAIKAIKKNPVRKQASLILKSYLSGEEFDQIAASVGVSKRVVSSRLHQLEKDTGVAIIRRSISGRTFKGVTRAPQSKQHGARLKRGSLRGWHSFRTSFITQALSAGLPIELVRRVTGHHTVDVVLKHYFRPGREEFSKAMVQAMPKFLSETAGKNTTIEALEKIKFIANSCTPKSLEEDLAAIVALADKLLAIQESTDH